MTTNKYHIVKSITLSAILQADKNNGCFREQFNRFVNEFAKTHTVDFWKVWHIDDVVAWFRYIPDLEHWLVYHEFIEAEKRYYVNQIFENSAFKDRVYMITIVGHQAVGLIRIPKSGCFDLCSAEILPYSQHMDDSTDLPVHIVDELFKRNIHIPLCNMKDITPKGAK